MLLEFDKRKIFDANYDNFTSNNNKMHEVTINGKTIKVDDKRLLAIKVVYGKSVIDETETTKKAPKETSKQNSKQDKKQ